MGEQQLSRGLCEPVLGAQLDLPEKRIEHTAIAGELTFTQLHHALAQLL